MQSLLDDDDDARMDAAVTCLGLADTWERGAWLRCAVAAFAIY